MLSYAQNFEDVMLQRLFEEVPAGFYVDLGAWDPKLHSVTQHFYDLGWRGVNVEPIKSRYNAFIDARPRDINLNKAVGLVAGTLQFYECIEDSALSTLDAATANSLRERGLSFDGYEVETITLQKIFDQWCPETVDFLKIDIEGFEGKLLNNFDLIKYRPRCLVVEATLPATQPSGFDKFHEVEMWSSWEPKVLSQGYEFVHFDGLNRFYLRSEDAALGSRLTLPPGVFDRFERFADLEKISALKAEIEIIDADRAARLDQINTLTKMVQELQAAAAGK